MNPVTLAMMEAMENSQIVSHIRGNPLWNLDLKEGSKKKKDGNGPLANQFVEKGKLDYYFGELFPMPTFHTLLSKQDLKSLRRVCRDWKKTINAFLETATDFVEPDFSDYRPLLRAPSLLTFRQKRRQIPDSFLSPRLSHSSGVIKFLGDFKDHPGTPFLSRRLSLDLIAGDDEGLFWDNAEALLDKFGVGLRSLTLDYESVSTSAEMLHTLQEFLVRVPQLTSLDCTLFSRGRRDGSSDEVPIPEFPQLEGLTRLSIYFKGPAPSIFLPFVTYFDQLVSLDVCHSEKFMAWFQPEVHSTFPKLQHLAVHICNAKALFKLLTLEGQLREVVIHGGLYSKGLCISPVVCFSFMERFSRSLNIFKIFHTPDSCGPMATMEDLGLPESPVINLPHLKIVYFTVMECGYGELDPLLRLSKTPEYIEIKLLDYKICATHEMPSPDNHPGVIHAGRETILIHGYLDRMYESNLWSLLPAVQELQVSKLAFPDRRKSWARRYTRAGYEQIQREGEPTPEKRLRGQFD